VAIVIGFSKMAFDSASQAPGHWPRHERRAEPDRADPLRAGHGTVHGRVPAGAQHPRAFLPALGGALAAGISWAAIGKAFTALVLSTSRLTLVYAGFAVVIAAFVWTYLGWLILLAGAQLSFYLQNPQNLRVGHQVLRLSGSEQERLALDLMAQVAQRHHAGDAPGTIESLSRWLGLPGSTIGDMAEHLERAGLLAIADDGRLFPARDIASIQVRQIIESVRSRSSGHDPHPRASTPGVQQLQDQLEEAWRAACGERTLVDLIWAASAETREP
jgi:membrane protein